MSTREHGPKHSPLSGALLPLLLVMLAACAGGGDATRDTTSAGGAAVAAAGQPASQAEMDRDERDVANYRLTMDKVDKYFAVSRNLAIAGKNMPQDTSEDADEDLPDASNQTFKQWEEEINRLPFARREFARAGMSPREFYVLAFAMFQAWGADAILKQSPRADVDSLARELNANPSVLRANLQFMRENEAHLKAKQKALEELKP
ncbi:MAG: hypothetical protein M3282_08420 [Gemmatimonadota bacterium]|nr:hypothetical protein [Gemmatimonadota bacterium]